MLLSGQPGEAPRGRGRGRVGMDSASSPSRADAVPSHRDRPGRSGSSLPASETNTVPTEKSQSPCLTGRGRARPRRPEQQLYVPRGRRDHDQQASKAPVSKRSRPEIQLYVPKGRRKEKEKSVETAGDKPTYVEQFESPFEGDDSSGTRVELDTTAQSRLLTDTVTWRKDGEQIVETASFDHDKPACIEQVESPLNIDVDNSGTHAELDTAAQSRLLSDTVTRRKDGEQIVETASFDSDKPCIEQVESPIDIDADNSGTQAEFDLAAYGGFVSDSVAVDGDQPVSSTLPEMDAVNSVIEAENEMTSSGGEHSSMLPVCSVEKIEADEVLCEQVPMCGQEDPLVSAEATEEQGEDTVMESNVSSGSSDSDGGSCIAVSELGDQTVAPATHGEEVQSEVCCVSEHSDSHSCVAAEGVSHAVADRNNHTDISASSETNLDSHTHSQNDLNSLENQQDLLSVSNDEHKSVDSSTVLPPDNSELIEEQSDDCITAAAISSVDIPLEAGDGSHISVLSTDDENVDEEEEDSWDKIFDDNGDCLEPSMIEELTAHVGEVEISKPKKTINYLDYQAKEPDIDMSAYSHVIEISDFPAEFQSRDLFTAFKDYMSRGFDLKWVDDTHALGIFSSTIAAQDALKMVHPMMKLKPLTEASKQCRSKARRCQEFLQPYKTRPVTSAAAARRLVTGALGMAPRLSKEQRDEERKVLKEAREKKRQDRKQKDAIWDGNVGKCAMDDC